MSRLLTVLSLAVAVTAAAALVVVPAVEGADAQAVYARGVPAEPGMILVSGSGYWPTQAFHPNGTYAFHHWLRESWSTAIAIQPNGDFVIAPQDGALVQVYDPNGTRVFSFGELGLDPGELASIVGMAVDPSNGRIFVRDAGHGIQAFHPNGTYAFQVESAGCSGSGSVDKNMAVGHDGRVFAHCDGLVAVFHPNGTYAFTFGLNGTIALGRVFEDVGDASVGGIAVGPDGRVFVQNGSRIHVFHPNGTLSHSFTGASDDPYGASFAVGPDGRVYMRGFPTHTVDVFHPNGTLALTFGTSGRELGDFENQVLRIIVVPDGSMMRPPANGTGPPAPAPVICVGADLIECDLGPANGTGPPAPVTVVIEPRAPVGPLNLTGAGHAADLTIDVAGLAGPGGPPLDGSASSVVTFPPAETSVAASFATVTFPPSVAATHVPADGRLALRVTADVPDDARVQGALAYEGSGRVTLQRVVEVGDESGRVAFDMPVRILLEGQAGGRAFYIEGGADGTITPIDQACAADDTGRVHRHLGGAGECQIDSAAGDKIIYTYHFTKFGTALPERGATPPTVDTCSVSLGMPALGVSVRPGEYSEAVRQVIVNSGSAPFEGVGLAATPWVAGQGGGPAPAAAPPAAPPAPVVGTDAARISHVLTATLVESLPASVTEVSTAGVGGAYVPLAAGASVAAGLGGGAELPLWLRLNLTPYGDVRAAELVQVVTYQATCRMPAPP